MTLVVRSLDRRLAWLFGAACLLIGGAAAPVSAQQCASDADCEPEFACLRIEIDSERAPCVPDAGGCEQEPEPEPLGECVPRPIRCESDDDCPAGLSCERDQIEQCATSPAGGEGDDGSGGEDDGSSGDEPIDCTVTLEPTGQCVYELIECETDDDCGELVCTAIGAEQSCSQEAAPGGTCPPGSECPAPEPVCSEPRVRNYCFPEPQACEDDAACGDGWRCVALPDDWEDDDDAPEGWQGVRSGCFPEGLALAIEGRVDVAGGEAKSASADDTSSRSGEADDAQASDSSSSDSSSSDCTVAAVGADDGRGAWWLALVGSTLALAVRRRAARG